MTITISENLFQQMRTALEVTEKVLNTHRLAGTDQNPKGVNDLVGSALLEADRVLARIKTVDTLGQSGRLIVDMMRRNGCSYYQARVALKLIEFDGKLNRIMPNSGSPMETVYITRARTIMSLAHGSE